MVGERGGGPEGGMSDDDTVAVYHYLAIKVGKMVTHVRP